MMPWWITIALCMLYLSGGIFIGWYVTQYRMRNHVQ